VGGGYSPAMRLILDLRSRIRGQSSPRRFAGSQFKHGDERSDPSGSSNGGHDMVARSKERR
jgi:hypothetical protein